jgi:nitrate ABC transporter ATP-binding subunit
MTDAKYLQLWQVTKTYATQHEPFIVVEDFDLNVAEGEFVCLVGHSGCGKSTILSMVAGLLPPTRGGIILAGREISGPGPDRGVVFQSPSLLPWMTARENVQLGLGHVQPPLSKSAQRETAIRFLTAVGLHDAIDRRPGELSVGMRQRVGIARAFALNPKMLLLDEPFGMLDSLTRLELQQVLLDLWREDRKTALMVTHDVDEALFLADRVVLMTCGPAARVGEIVTIPFARPRNRTAILEQPEYYQLRERLLTFLEEQAQPQEDSVAVAGPQTDCGHADGLSTASDDSTNAQLVRQPAC